MRRLGGVAWRPSAIASAPTAPMRAALLTWFGFGFRFGFKFGFGFA